MARFRFRAPFNSPRTARDPHPDSHSTGSGTSTMPAAHESDKTPLADRVRHGFFMLFSMITLASWRAASTPSANAHSESRKSANASSPRTSRPDWFTPPSNRDGPRRSRFGKPWSRSAIRPSLFDRLTDEVRVFQVRLRERRIRKRRARRGPPTPKVPSFLYRMYDVPVPPGAARTEYPYTERTRRSSTPRKSTRPTRAQGNGTFGSRSSSRSQGVSRPNTDMRRQAPVNKLVVRRFAPIASVCIKTDEEVQSTIAYLGDEVVTVLWSRKESDEWNR